MADRDDGTVSAADVRRVMHDVNNLAARVLTKAEVALVTGDPDQQRAALERIAEIADEIGAYVRSARADLLDR